MFKDYYTLLDVEFGAGQEKIRKAYYTQCKKWHPDTHPEEDTTQRMQDINEAYLILKDKEAKERYDAEYLKYKKYERGKQENTKQSREEETQKTTQEKYSDTGYEFTDDVLSKWVKNARRQAKEMAEEITDELRGSLKSALKNVSDNILPVIIGYVLGPVVIFLIFKSCS